MPAARVKVHPLGDRYVCTPGECYAGMRDQDLVASVWKRNGSPLPPRLDEVNHSPTGFEWGYSGSGPAQLAYAILRDALGPAKDQRLLAERLHQQFKFEVLSGLQGDSWVIAAADVLAWVEHARRGILG